MYLSYFVSLYVGIWLLKRMACTSLGVQRPSENPPHAAAVFRRPL
ncbi:hypothetical protein HMPREF9120_01931 [Neisseria sp. oral taxon 020 str. F0370]|nr:hypothetical protein HMPREF9120_01931 [Neisseria sp. oral taxon 020 str. F0370]